MEKGGASGVRTCGGGFGVEEGSGLTMAVGELKILINIDFALMHRDAVQFSHGDRVLTDSTHICTR
jgi:hypothetical protein